MKSFKIGIDNYGLYPLKLSPLETLEWAKKNGAEGVAFSGLNPDDRKLITKSYLKKLAAFAAENDLYIEWGGAQHIPRNMTSWKRKKLLAINKRAAREAAILGTRIIRSCSGGLMRWNSDNPSTEKLLAETARALKGQLSMLRDYNVILAIETHFEFTSFELLKLFEMCEVEPDDCLGICLDTMNLLTMLEDPFSATRRLLPYVVSTHIKDGGIMFTDDGFVTFPTEIGSGVVDLKAIIKKLATSNRDMDLSIEDHGGSFVLPFFDPQFLAEFPDLTVKEFTHLSHLAMRTKRLVDRNDCRIIDRDAWGNICEERLINDLMVLKSLLSEL